MKVLLVTGILLIILGVLSLVSEGITYTKKEKLLELGPIEATAQRQKTVSLPPLVGVLFLTAGVVLTVVAARK